LFLIGKKLFDDFEQDGDDWAAGWLLQVLKKHKPIFFNNKEFNHWFITNSDENINYDELQLKLLEQKFEDADRLTSLFLRKLAGKLAEKRGYVFYSEVNNIKVGDFVSSSPASTLLPPNIPIGIVQSIDETLKSKKTAKILLLAKPHVIDWVQILKENI